MKGAHILPKPPFLIDFIKGLDHLAEKNFPGEEVTRFLKDNPFEEDWLQPYRFFSEKKYTRNLLHKRAEYEILLLCWMPKQVSPVHGHEGEKCWMRVEGGELYFTNYDQTVTETENIIHHKNEQPGNRGFVDGPAFIHKVANLTDAPAMSLHLYARPFAQCDIFDIEHQTHKRVDLRYDTIDGKCVNPDLIGFL